MFFVVIHLVSSHVDLLSHLLPLLLLLLLLPPLLLLLLLIIRQMSCLTNPAITAVVEISKVMEVPEKYRGKLVSVKTLYC